MNAKGGKEDIFKLTMGIESVNEIHNDNGTRTVNFATSKNLESQKYNVPMLSHP
jgi:hypothetical protein